jgi:O-antigen/teichoic acid export membrane protein
VQGRGAVAAVLGLLTLFVVLGGVGVPEALTHWVARRPDVAGGLARRAGAVVAASGVVLTGALLTVGRWLARDVPDAWTLLVIAAAGLLPALGVAVLRGVAAGHGRWGRVAAERAVSSVARLVLTVLPFVAGRLTVEVAVAVLVGCPVLGGLAYLGRQPPGLSPGPSSESSSESSSQPGRRDEPPPTTAVLVSYGGRVWFGSVAGILLLRLDQAVMLPLSDAAALGLYAVAVAVGEVPLVLNAAFRDVLFSAESASRDDERLARAARTSLVVCLAAVLALALPLAWWLPLVFGADFAAAVPACLVLLLAAAVSPPGSVAGVGLSARGRPDLRSWSLVLALAVNVAALVVLVPVWGALGAALATLFGNAVASHTNVLLLRRHHGIAVRRLYLATTADVRFVASTGLRLARTTRRPR